MLAGILWFIYLIGSCLTAFYLGRDDGHFERKILYYRGGKGKIILSDIQKKKFSYFLVGIFLVPIILFFFLPGFSMRWLLISIISSVVGSFWIYSHGYILGETELKIGEFRRDNFYR